MVTIIFFKTHADFFSIYNAMLMCTILTYNFKATAFSIWIGVEKTPLANLFINKTDHMLTPLRYEWLVYMLFANLQSYTLLKLSIALSTFMGTICISISKGDNLETYKTGVYSQEYWFLWIDLMVGRAYCNDVMLKWTIKTPLYSI